MPTINDETLQERYEREALVDERIETRIAAAEKLEPKSDEPEKWGSYFDGDERVTVYETEGEAAGEIECEIDRDHEPVEEITYCVAPMLSGKHILRKDNAQRIGDDLFERINERVNDDMYAEDVPLDMTPEDLLALGQLVIDFICANAKVQWWTVDTKREQKRTYVSGSNDATSVQHLPADDTEGGEA